MSGTHRLGLLSRTAMVAVACVALSVHGAGAASPRPGFTFADGGHARIPFELSRQHVWIRGLLNGADSVWIVVDTGAAASCLDDGVAQRLGLERTHVHEARGAGGAQLARRVENLTLELPGLTFRPRHMTAIDFSSVSMAAGRPMEVVLGYELFEACVVRFDYANGVMDVWRNDRAPRDTAGVTVPMTLIQNHPYVEGTLALPGRRPLTGRFVIDSGSSAALIVTPEVTERESLASAFPRTLVAMSRGVGGELRNVVGRAESFDLGGLRFEAPIVLMPDPGAGRVSVSGSIGNIGGEILRRCRVSFDYGRRRVRFEPSAGFDRPFEAEMCGAAFTRTGTEMVVRWVGSDTPAAEAGLRVGDRVVTIDGEPALSVDPAVLRRRLQEEGRVVVLKVDRGAETIEARLKLRRLL